MQWKQLVRKAWLILVVVSMVTLAGVPRVEATRQRTLATSLVDQAGGPQDRITVSLEVDKAPGTGEQAMLTVVATPLLDAPDLTIHWQVTQDGVVLDDATISLGAVSAKQTMRAQRPLRLPAAGNYEVSADVAFAPVSGASFGATGVLFFVVGNGATQVTTANPATPVLQGSVVPAAVTRVAARIVTPLTPNEDGCFTVRGTLRRVDKGVSPAGHTPDQMVVVKFANIEISEEDIVFDDTIEELQTDAQGAFSVDFCEDDGVFDDTLEIYVEVESEIIESDTLIAEVVDASFIDEVYEFPTAPVSSDGGTLTFNIDLGQAQSAVFNMLDAVRDARRFWGASGGEFEGDDQLDDEITVLWEPTYGITVSHYFSHLGINEITIADDPSDIDAWDDSVIIHEWGHMADDYYSCDDSPGGPHSATSLIAPDLAWGEGYPDYYQSAVRAWRGDSNSNSYFDVRGLNNNIVAQLNLETWNVSQPTFVSPRNEIAIAAALWDLNDTVDDAQDRTSVGHNILQEVYSGDTFNGGACTMAGFMQAWVDDGKPTTPGVAAIMSQNTGLAQLPAPSARSVAAVGDTSSVLTPFTPATNYKWWRQLALLVDNGTSMSGPKMTAVKSVLGQQVATLMQAANGTEIALQTFNNTSTSNRTLAAGQFYADRITPAITNLAITPDTGCAGNAFGALAQTVVGKYGIDAWVFTDGDTKASGPNAAQMQGLLTKHNARASFAVLGVCPSAARSADEAPATSSLTAQLSALVGAAAEVEAGVVPYILTAINSGGQFLYVDAAQTNDATAILQAQLTHSAGAGRWSDYVSTNATYQFDTLASWEYNWIDATVGGTLAGNPNNGALDITLPTGFRFFNQPQTTASAYRSGYLTLGTRGADQPINTALPNPAAPNNVLYPFWDAMEWTIPCVAESQNCSNGAVYTKQSGDWFVVEYRPLRNLNFEVLLNRVTHEVRYQYKTVDSAAGATIGLENLGGTNALQVSFNQATGASNGMGYKFTPAPPQPTKIYNVTVDAQLQSLGLLLTGYSGTFAPIVVRAPDGTVVACANNATSRCLSLGLVQYLQVPVAGRIGTWTVEVRPGASGAGTFAFSSFALGKLSPSSPTLHTLPTNVATPIVVDLGQAVSGNVMQGRFRTPTNAVLGAAFTLFDDGAHGDGAAADGRFGSAPITPAGVGPAYLWLTGNLNGGAFTRSDAVPFSFQPLGLSAPALVNNTGALSPLPFTVTNADTFRHCYDVNVLLPEGWERAADVVPPLCLNPGATATRTVQVQMSDTTPNTLPSGSEGEVTFAVVESEQGVIQGTTSTLVRRVRPAVEVLISANAEAVRPVGAVVPVEITVFDAQGVAVADGTVVQLSATQGTLTPVSVTTVGGGATATFTSNGAPGAVAKLTARINATVSGATTLRLEQPEPAELTLTVSAAVLPADGIATSEVIATLRDREGQLMANQPVRIGVEGDGENGRLNGQELVSGMTNAQGQFRATYTGSTTPGRVKLRAEFMTTENGNTHPAFDARASLILTANVYKAYLPVVVR